MRLKDRETVDSRVVLSLKDCKKVSVSENKQVMGT